MEDIHRFKYYQNWMKQVDVIAEETVNRRAWIKEIPNKVNF